MDQRAKGIETEFGLGVLEPGAVRHHAEFHELDVLGWPGTPVWLSNGGCRYLDGLHPEWATPECVSVLDLIAYDRAGEREMEALAVAAERRLRGSGRDVKVHVFKNNVDTEGGSYGSHENYSTEREVYDALTGRDGPGEVLAMFLVTRALLTGAGHVVAHPDGSWSYGLSQRAEPLWEWLGRLGDEHYMLFQKDEPQADPRRFGRLHVTVGDSNMSQTTTLLKIVSTELVLAMLEAGERLDDLAGARPFRLLLKIDRDPRGTTPVPLRHRAPLTVLELQFEFFTRARVFARQTGRDREPAVQQALELWGRSLRAIATGDLRPVARDLDWVIKLSLLERAAERYRRHHHGEEMPVHLLQRHDLAYHDVRRDYGTYYGLERRGGVNRVVSDLRILEAKSKPPHDTRAFIRGSLVRAACDAVGRAEARFSWQRVEVLGADGRVCPVLMPNPLQSSSPAAEVALTALRSSARAPRVMRV